MYYGKRTVKEMDEYYCINMPTTKDDWIKTDCEKIQSAFNNHGIQLTLAECRELYETYSDESSCSSWDGYIDNCSEEGLFSTLLPWLKDIIKDRVHRLSAITEQLELNGYME